MHFTFNLRFIEEAIYDSYDSSFMRTAEIFAAVVVVFSPKI